MRRGCAAALAIVVLALAPAVSAAEPDRATLERYAKATWASFVAMTDESSGLPTDILNADGTRVPQTSTTNIGAYMWSAVAAERLGIIGHTELVRRLRVTISTLERHGATRAERAVLQLVRPPHGREADRLAAERRPPYADPVLGRQRLARHRLADRAQRRARARRARGRALRLDALRALLRPHAQPDPLPLRAATRARGPAATTRSSQRAGSPTTSGPRRGSCRRRPTTAAGAASPTAATPRGRRRGRPASSGRTSASRSTRAAIPTTTRGSSRAGAARCSRR